MIRGGVVSLVSSDLANAVRFYVETLGMKLLSEREGASVIDSGDGFRIELRRADEGSPKVTPAQGFAIGLFPKLPIDEAIAILENRGVIFRIEDRGRSVVAHFQDLDGTPLFLREDR